MLFHELSKEMQDKVKRGSVIRHFYNQGWLACNCCKIDWGRLKYYAIDGKTQYFMSCLRCGNTGQFRDSEQEAIQAWNTEVTLLNS